jgi:hypothetical protein
MIVLSFQQEKFAQGVVKGMTQADAYRVAYKTANMKQDTIHQAASRLMADSKVAARLAELRAPVAERVDMTLHAHVSRLAQIRDAAMKVGNMARPPVPRLPSVNVRGTMFRRLKSSKAPSKA